MIESESSTAPVESPLTSTSDAAPSVPSTQTDGLSSVGLEVDAMFGYRAPSLVRDETDDVDAGAPPAPSSEAKSPTDQPAAGAPPADAAQSTTPEAPVADDDPLKDATPFTYTVNGQERSDDKIKLVKDLGAFIDPKDVPYIQHKLAERDNLFEKGQESFQKYQRLEALTTWPKRDGDNKVVGTLTGPEAVEAARLDYGNALAKIESYEALLNDPARLASLLTFDQERQAWGHNDDQVARLLMAIENRQLKLTPQIKQHLASLSGPAATSAPTAPASPAAPAVSASSAVDMAIKHAAIAGFTPADTTWAESIVPRYMRTATAEDVRSTPTLTLGEPILDPQFIDLLRDRAQIRAESAKQATAAAGAARANAPKLAAALAGRTQRPAAPAVRQPAPRATDDDELSPEEQAFAARERASAQALRARSA